MPDHVSDLGIIGINKTAHAPRQLKHGKKNMVLQVICKEPGSQKSGGLQEGVVNSLCWRGTG